MAVLPPVVRAAGAESAFLPFGGFAGRPLPRALVSLAAVELFGDGRACLPPRADAEERADDLAAPDFFDEAAEREGRGFRGMVGG